MVYRSPFLAERSSGSRLFLFLFLLLAIQNLCTSKEIPTKNINKDEDEPALEVFEDLEGRQERSLSIDFKVSTLNEEPNANLVPLIVNERMDIGKESSESLEKFDTRSQAMPGKGDYKGRSEVNIVIINVDGPPKECPKNQKYYECKPICNTCEFYGKNIQCNLQCVDGCFCDEEHVMTKDGQCVKPGECGKRTDFGASVPLKLEPLSVNGKCKLPPKSGKGKCTSTRYYYNYKSGICEKFTYCGHRSNRNNFKTEQECLKTCVICPPHSVYAKNGPICESCGGRRCLGTNFKPNCYCEKGYGRQNATDICTKCPWLRN